MNHPIRLSLLSLGLVIAASAAPLAAEQAQPTPAHAEEGHQDHDPDHGKKAKPVAHEEGDGHDHGKEAKPEAAHDEHGGDHHEGGEGEHGDEHGHEEEHSDEATLTPEAIARYGIKLGKAERKSVAPAIAVPAQIAFNAETIVHITATLPGRIAEIKVRVGDAVKKGDPLLLIDSPELGQAQSEFIEKTTTARAGKPAADISRDAWSRGRKLYDQAQGIPLTEVKKRESDMRLAERDVQIAEGAALAARNRLALYGMSETEIVELEKTQKVNPRVAIVAPIDAKVVEREATLGELVGNEPGPLLILADDDPLWVIADVPERRLSGIAVGSAAIIVVPALSGKRLSGQVSHVSAALDEATRTAKVRLELPNPQGALRPGMFAQVEIAGEAAQEAIYVPDAALQNVEGAPAVFVPVAGEPGTFAKRAVRVGETVNGLVPVIEGLADGEEIVVSGSFILKAELGKAGAAHEH
jgi:cobalt-zinc-cadmium efflux system membrane fusion protein